MILAPSSAADLISSLVLSTFLDGVDSQKVCIKPSFITRSLFSIPKVTNYQVFWDFIFQSIFKTAMNIKAINQPSLN
jgi:hypothetical protein